MNKRVGLDKKTIDHTPLDGETVLLRADYNVPLDEHGKITDDYRLRMSLPTIQALVRRGCRVVICSHLGRPKGEVDPTYSLEPVAKQLLELLGQPVRFVSDCVGDKPRQAVRRMKAGDVLLMENLRFHPGEEANDPQFAQSLARASRAKYFVQDGFGVVHREHASTAAIADYLPGVAGKLLECEVDTITRAMNNPKRPLVAVLGGAKVSDKIGLVKQFVKAADQVVIGGAMANTFLAHQGVNIGSSVYEPGFGGAIDEVYAVADGRQKIILPEDAAVASTTETNEVRREVELAAITEADKILDVGPKTIAKVGEVVAQAGTVIWNGTLGLAELPQFAEGSRQVAQALASRPELESIVGGGDTADFVLGWDKRGGASFSHVSTGGGASLNLMAGEKLPGVEVLLDA